MFKSLSWRNLTIDVDKLKVIQGIDIKSKLITFKQNEAAEDSASQILAASTNKICQ